MTKDPYIPPPAGQMWLVPTDGPVDDDLVRLGLDNAFPGLPEELSLERAERSIRAALAAVLPLYERKIRQRIAEEIRYPLLAVDPQESVTAVGAEREQLVHDNPELAQQIRDGIEEAEAGQTVYLGSFAQYLDDEDEEGCPA